MEETGRTEDGKEEEEAKKVPLFGMFRYADRVDVLLMVVGTVGAVANGVSAPLMSVLFGDGIDSFGENTSQSVLRSVTKVVLNFIYLGIGTSVASFLHTSVRRSLGWRALPDGPAAAVDRAAIAGDLLDNLLAGLG